MLSANIFTSVVLFLGLAMAAPSPTEEMVTSANKARAECIINGPENCHGERTCVAGGISCEYADGSRCAKLASTDGSFTAFCPDGHWDNGVYHDIYTGAGCISAFTVLGRHQCS